MQQLLDSSGIFLTIAEMVIRFVTDFSREVYYAEMGMPLRLYL